MSDPAPLDRLGLRAGEPVRFLRVGRDRWEEGRVDRACGDDAVTVRDAQGAARTFRTDQLEVLRPDGRGRLTWRTVRGLSSAAAQLDFGFEA